MKLHELTTMQLARLKDRWADPELSAADALGSFALSRDAVTAALGPKAKEERLTSRRGTVRRKVLKARELAKAVRR